MVVPNLEFTHFHIIAARTVFNRKLRVFGVESLHFLVVGILKNIP